MIYSIAVKIGEISYLFYGKARENINANLRRILPEADSATISLLSLKTFRNYSKYLVDYGRFSSLDRDTLFKEMVCVEGGGNIDEALGRGKGLILLTAHLGNWELGGIFFGRQEIKINVLTFRDGIVDIDDIKERYRKLHNINTIVLGDSPFAGIEVLNALGRNEVVAMLVDRPEANGIPVTFFGKKTTFPQGPILLAGGSGAAIVPGFVVREKDGYRGVAEKPIYFDKDRGDTPESVAASIVKVFEEYIRRYPDQWYNFVPM